MTTDLVILAGLAGLSALIVLVMIRHGRLDRPGPRSSHEIPTPKGGGVGIASAFVIGTPVLAVTHSVPSEQLAMLIVFVLAASVLAATAFLDDLFDWPFSIKLGAQLIAAVFVVAASLNLANSAAGTGGFVAFAAICWIVVVTNAMNFIDGLNGLASGVALLASLFLVIANGPLMTILVAAPALALAAGVIGFLPFNYPKARIFMGDVGSQLCGFVVGTLGASAALKLHSPSEVLLVPLILNGVLFDVAFTLLRRTWRGSRLTEAHREHLYQLAQRSGMHAWLVTLIHWTMALWGGACAISLRSPADGLAVAQAIIAVLVPQCLWLSYVAAKSRRASLPF